MRSASFGAHQKPTIVDRFGRYLSSRTARRQVGNTNAAVTGDIGCGHDAKLALSVFANAAEIHLFDLTIDEAITGDTIQRHIGPLPHTLVDLPDGMFDALIFNNVLEHLVQPAETIAEIHRILKPGGRLFVNVPTWRGKVALEFAAFKLGIAPAEEMEDHKIYYDKKTLWPALVSAGFRPSCIRMRTHKCGLNLYARVVKR